MFNLNVQHALEYSIRNFLWLLLAHRELIIDYNYFRRDNAYILILVEGSWNSVDRLVSDWCLVQQLLLAILHYL